MKIHLVKNYNGDETLFPQRELIDGSVKFEEPENMKELSKTLIIRSIIIIIVLLIIFYIRTNSLNLSLIGIILAIICLIPHEILHSIVYKSDVYFYINLKLGLLFVISTEDISKIRFIIMNLLPNLIFGVVPFLIFLFNPSYTILGTLGAVSLSMGSGDYYNIISAIKQMPKGSRTYLNGMNSYWYMP